MFRLLVHMKTSKQVEGAREVGAISNGITYGHSNKHVDDLYSIIKQ